MTCLPPSHSCSRTTLFKLADSMILPIFRHNEWLQNSLAVHGWSTRFYKAGLGMQAQRRESNAQAGRQEVQELEFVCNGQAVPFDLSLAGVRSFIWRRSDNLVIHFRIYNPNKPAPLPVVKAP